MLLCVLCGRIETPRPEYGYPQSEKARNLCVLGPALPALSKYISR
jgi:hypothetical protein